MALTFVAYVAPPGWLRPLAVAAVVALAAVNHRGVTRTARLTRLIVTVVLLALAVTIAALFRPRLSRPGPAADRGRGQLVRRAAGRRVVVLRLRRLRAHRHHGRRGARPRAHDPARHPGRSGRHRRHLRHRGGGGP